ncbi:MAG TPA: pitrilysin family protein [Vicinamibacterales bacterium]|nr:pitrilysin family protein [Vicinamibacterales bacterium]
MKLRALAVALLLAQALVFGQGAAAPPAPPKFKGKAPVSNEVIKVKLPRAQETQLSNGAYLMVLEDHRVPSVQFEIIMIGAGGYYDPADVPGLAATTASLMDEGTTTRSSEQIAQALDTMAASVNVSAGQGSQIATVTGSALTDQFDAVLALASDILLNPSFPEKEIGLYKVRSRAGLEEQRSDPDFLRQERYSKAVYGKHPASSVGLTRESLEKVTRDTLVAFHKANYVPDHAVIGVSGDITLAEARTKFETALKSWAKSGKPLPGVSDPPDHGPMKISLVNRPGSVQTAFMLGEQAIDRTHPDYDAMIVMNQILGGSNGRLYRELRERKGYTYGVYSNARLLRYRGDWRSQMDVRTDVTDASLRDLLAEINKMRDELVPIDEFRDAQRSLTASFALSLENPASLLNLYIVRQLYKFPVDYWDKYTDRISAVTPSQVQAVARKYLDPKRLQIVAVGDAAKIADDLRTFGPLEVYDDEGKPVK